MKVLILPMKKLDEINKLVGQAMLFVPRAHVRKRAETEARLIDRELDQIKLTIEAANQGLPIVVSGGAKYWDISQLPDNTIGLLVRKQKQFGTRQFPDYRTCYSLLKMPPEDRFLEASISRCQIAIVSVDQKYVVLERNLAAVITT